MAKRTPALDFDSYYRLQYGERWDALRTALGQTREPIAFTDGLVQPYYLDAASVLAAQSLGVQRGDRVLDMCAAPGGKTLVLASALAGEGTLVANDRSANRRARLRTVLNEHLSEEFRAPITITSHDSTKWSLYEQDAYDKILLDAPCSSERHVLSDTKALAQWSPSRPKRLAITQFAMLAAALDAAVVGGLILYVTCSINSGENEAVIEKLAKRRSGRFVTEPLTISQAEDRSYGAIILPDRAEGMGPLYLCLLRRTSS
ncbi:MAG TPA: RsmB/NOP family class I SAM-dependent RNA methyltransferase [Sphaerochaeta sp.]|nr:RsmB/NOP family class I SAM-dependent RNA methyltransferase [Sphaerochaeta sp.]